MHSETETDAPQETIGGTIGGTEGDTTRKDPEDWVTGDEPMTGAQRSYLKTLSEEAHVDFDDTLTKAEASRRIDELQQQTGRGKGAGGSATSGTSARENRSGAQGPRSERGGDAADGSEPANPGSAGTAGDEATLSIGSE